MSNELEKLLEATGDDLHHLYAEEFVKARDRNNTVIRQLVLEHRRLDILYNYVLRDPNKSELQPFHYEMMEWQEMNQEGMLLAWRGSLKTTICTITRVIFEILLDPNIRILLASEAGGQAQGFLRAIKSHFESNDRLRAIFGDYYNTARTWAEMEITVHREIHAVEPTVMCTGMGMPLPSRHFDLIIVDDLVTKANSQTDGQRKKVKEYFYETLYPTLESPDGRLWVLGTRWHEEDLYGWFSDNDYSESFLVIGVLEEATDLSRWEAKFPTERLHRQRDANLPAFELQMMCRSGVGMGNIYMPHHFLLYEGVLPDDVFLWQGVDLAAGQQEQHDSFAHVTIAIHKTLRDPYLVSYRITKMPFPQQTKFVAERFYDNPEVVRVVVESNACQLFFKQQMRETYPDVPVFAHPTIKDKVVRANQVAAFLEERPLRVRRHHGEIVRLLCGFPNLKGSKDIHDALEIALGRGLKGARKKRRKEPGLI